MQLWALDYIQACRQDDSRLLGRKIFHPNPGCQIVQIVARRYCSDVYCMEVALANCYRRTGVQQSVLVAFTPKTPNSQDICVGDYMHQTFQIMYLIKRVFEKKSIQTHHLPNYHCETSTHITSLQSTYIRATFLVTPCRSYPLN